MRRFSSRRRLNGFWLMSLVFLRVLPPARTPVRLRKNFGMWYQRCFPVMRAPGQTQLKVSLLHGGLIYLPSLWMVPLQGIRQVFRPVTSRISIPPLGCSIGKSRSRVSSGRSGTRRPCSICSAILHRRASFQAFWTAGSKMTTSGKLNRIIFFPLVCMHATKPVCVGKMRLADNCVRSVGSSGGITTGNCNE